MPWDIHFATTHKAALLAAIQEKLAFEEAVKHGIINLAEMLEKMKL